MGRINDLRRMGEKLLDAARTELFLAMRFMGPAFMSLSPQMDLSVRTIGTDAALLRYHPVWLMNTYLEHPYILDRTYLHTILHCLFRHMYGLKTHPDQELWDLASDIAAESVIDSMDLELVRRTPSDFREEWYGILGDALHVLTAEKIYRYFSENVPPYDLLVRLSREFFADDHVYWPDINRNEPAGAKTPSSGLPSENREDMWKHAAKRVRSELTFSEKKAGKNPGDLERVLGFDLRERLLYGDLLRKFCILQEELRVDPDSFDYGFYHYGMELYGDMPLIEENEFAENRRIRELVIAIDTSASVTEEILRKFLTETASILLAGDSFFRKFELHVLFCDAKVQEEIVVTDAESLLGLKDGIAAKGGGGTDFRPAFRYVDDLRAKGFLRNLSGFIYFTDGFGTYPARAPAYETAFVFFRDDLFDDAEVPGWAVKVYL